MNSPYLPYTGPQGENSLEEEHKQVHSPVPKIFAEEIIRELGIHY